MSKKEFENLLKSVLDLNPQLTQEAIALDLGYNEGYISQMISRGKISQKFVNALQLKFLQNANSVKKKGDSWEPPLDDLIEEKAILKTLVNHIIKLEAIVYTRPVEDVRRDFKLDTNLLLDELTGGAVSKA